MAPVKATAHATQRARERFDVLRVAHHTAPWAAAQAIVEQLARDGEPLTPRHHHQVLWDGDKDRPYYKGKGPVLRVWAPSQGAPGNKALVAVMRARTVVTVFALDAAETERYEQYLLTGLWAPKETP